MREAYGTGYALFLLDVIVFMKIVRKKITSVACSAPWIYNFYVSPAHASSIMCIFSCQAEFLF